MRVTYNSVFSIKTFKNRGGGGEILFFDNLWGKKLHLKKKVNQFNGKFSMIYLICQTVKIFTSDNKLIKHNNNNINLVLVIFLFYDWKELSCIFSYS